MAPLDTTPIPRVRLSGVRFRWHRRLPPALEISELSIGRGERLFVHGPSGTGKTTLLSLLGGVVVPECGRVEIDGTDIARLSGTHRDRFRADHIGFLFQLFNLIPYLSAAENVILPCQFSTARRRKTKRRHGTVRAAAGALLHHMGLDADALSGSPVAKLSVGQQQRVAAARALIGEPGLLIADEPTSALDADNRQAFLDLLFREAERAGATVMFVSHDLSLASAFHRALAISDVNLVTEKA